MPPLCTGGYGLTTAHWSFMLGALYLFFINCVFIALATFLVAKILPLPNHTFAHRKQARRVQWAVWAVALLTAVPSVYLAAGIVRSTIFTHNARQFVDEQFNQSGTYIVTRRIEPATRTINLLLAGASPRPSSGPPTRTWRSTGFLSHN